MKRALALTLAAMALSTAAQAGGWDESLQGDLSGDRLNPTPVTLGLGSNLVSGVTGNSGSGVDRDYFTFSVPANAVLSAIELLPDTHVSGGVSFIAIQTGNQITVTPVGVGFEALLGWAHYADDQINSDLLPVMLTSMSHQGPLNAGGTYAVWVQDTGGPAVYAFDFKLTAQPVPEPSTTLSLILGLAGLAALARRRSR